MPHWVEQQNTFACALLNPQSPLPNGVIAPDGEPSLKRFNVYRNNVIVSLIEALEAAYPATRRLVGVAFFQAMAQIFAVARPPQSPVMLDYGHGFAEFISGFEPAATLPYLADVARIERSWLEAYHAAEADSLGVDDFSAVTADLAPLLVFRLHPSVRTVQSRYPALSIWQMNVTEASPGEHELVDAAEAALIVRPSAEVEVHHLPPGGADFIDALGQGKTLGEAAQQALLIEGFDLALTLNGLLEAGAVTAFTTIEKRG
ncbi:MAG: DNA-binding domain-containing protein [Rhizomicrobium sp.]